MAPRDDDWSPWRLARSIVTAGALIFAGLVLSERTPSVREVAGWVLVYAGTLVALDAARYVVQRRRAWVDPEPPTFIRGRRGRHGA